MLHRINPPDIPSLVKLNQIARLTIAFGLTVQVSSSGQTTRQEFLQYFQDHGYNRAGAWLWGKPKAIKAPLLRLLKIPIAEKQFILEAYDVDMDLAACLQRGRFRTTQLPDQVQPALTLVKEILLNFYTHVLADGVKGATIEAQEELNRQAILRAFAGAQKPLRLHVCPGCDGQPPPLTNRHHADLDHFFPKSKYQFLAIHPLNLVPLCTDCNLEFKADRDAVSDADPEIVDLTSLEYIFHPYLRPAADAVDVVIERDGQTHHPHFRLLPKPDDTITRARVRSLNYLFRLTARWDGNLDGERIQEAFELWLLHGSQEERDAPEPMLKVDTHWFDVQLQHTLTTLKRSKGKLIGSLSLYAYAKWVQSDSEAHDDWVNICQKNVLS